MFFKIIVLLCFTSEQASQMILLYQDIWTYLRQSTQIAMHKYVKRRWMLPFFSYILPNFIPAFLFQINVLNGKVQYKSWLIF